MKSCELRSKALLSALHAELTGLKKAFKERTSMIDKFKVIKITIDYKKDKFSKENNQAQKAALETEIDNQ